MFLSPNQQICLPATATPSKAARNPPNSGLVVLVTAGPILEDSNSGLTQSNPEVQLAYSFYFFSHSLLRKVPDQFSDSCFDSEFYVFTNS